MCVTTTHYATHISTECSAGGSAQCDGYCVDHNVPCTCNCHTAWDLPNTVVAVRDWHDKQEGIVASFPDSIRGWNEAYVQARCLSVDGKEYRALAGQERVVVAERYV